MVVMASSSQVPKLTLVATQLQNMDIRKLKYTTTYFEASLW